MILRPNINELRSNVRSLKHKQEFLLVCTGQGPYAEPRLLVRALLFYVLHTPQLLASLETLTDVLHSPSI